jgi:sugar lactone lactonase YvrE
MFPTKFKAGGLAALVCAILLTPRAQASILVSFVSDINFGVGGVLSYDSNGSTNYGVSGGGAALAGPVQALWGNDGKIYVSSIGTGEILRYDGDTGVYLDTFVSGIAHDSSGGFDVGPLGMAFGPNGDLYVTNDFTNEVERYNGTTGALIGTFGSAHLSSPTGLTFDAAGNLYVASYNDNTIQQFSAAGTFLRTLTSVGLVDIGFGLGGPEQIAIGPNGNLFVANFNSSDVEQYSLATGNPVNGGIFVGGGSGALAGATGLLFTSEGWLYVASNFTDQLLRFNANSGSFFDVFKDANSGIYIEPGFLGATPEPASAVAIAFGLAGLAILFRRKAATASGRC